jgi:hypothetical protein
VWRRSHTPKAPIPGSLDDMQSLHVLRERIFKDAVNQPFDTIVWRALEANLDFVFALFQWSWRCQRMRNPQTGASGSGAPASTAVPGGHGDLGATTGSMDTQLGVPRRRGKQQSTVAELATLPRDSVSRLFHSDALAAMQARLAGTASSLMLMLCCAVLCCAVLCCAVLCCAVLCCAVLCCCCCCAVAVLLLCCAG